MEEFVCDISRDKLSKTNRIWGLSKLNAAWTIGMVSTLCTAKKFTSKEEFKEYYFESGMRREEIIKTLPEEEQRLATSIRMPAFIKTNYPHIHKLNTTYGRTIEQMRFIGDLFYSCIEKDESLNFITRRDARYLVLYRVIAETWNGIGLREMNTIASINRLFKQHNLDWRCSKIAGELDGRYEIDAQIVDGQGRLLLAIQIKPKSYRGQYGLKAETESWNTVKNKEFRVQYGKPVVYVYSTTRGEILNPEALHANLGLPQRKTA